MGVVEGEEGVGRGVVWGVGGWVGSSGGMIIYFVLVEVVRCLSWVG